jgi:hypothetical protein
MTEHPNPKAANAEQAEAPQTGASDEPKKHMGGPRDIPAHVGVKASEPTGGPPKKRNGRKTKAERHAKIAGDLKQKEAEQREAEKEEQEPESAAGGGDESVIGAALKDGMAPGPRQAAPADPSAEAAESQQAAPQGAPTTAGARRDEGDQHSGAALSKRLRRRPVKSKLPSRAGTRVTTLPKSKVPVQLLFDFMKTPGALPPCDP